MPNWCANTVTLEHTDPAMIARAKTAFEAGKFLQEFIPFPDGEWDYNWCIQEWGTKWDVGGDDCDVSDIEGGLMLGFDSAWAPPIAAYEKLFYMGFKIYATYYEPGMAFCGIFEDGSDEYYEYGDMNSDEVAATLPAELDEAYCISESMADWESEQEEENLDIDLDGGLSATNE